MKEKDLSHSARIKLNNILGSKKEITDISFVYKYFKYYCSNFYENKSKIIRESETEKYLNRFQKNSPKRATTRNFHRR